MTPLTARNKVVTHDQQPFLSMETFHVLPVISQKPSIDNRLTIFFSTAEKRLDDGVEIRLLALSNCFRLLVS